MMLSRRWATRWASRRVQAAYERLLAGEVGDVPEHVAVIQDGNRRYAASKGTDPEAGHRAGAQTTQEMVEWCGDLGIEELTLYAFSTENFHRPPEEREHLFDLIAEKLREFADAERVHEREVRIRAIGDLDLLPEHVTDAVEYAQRRTADYDQFRLNVALAYGGRDSLLKAARTIAGQVADGELDPAGIDLQTVESHLHGDVIEDVDLIIRTGGDERTSNFLPWHANGNEAAVIFCAPYWPEFTKVDFLRGIRTYHARTESWRRNRVLRAHAIVRAIGGAELAEARTILDRVRTREGGRVESVDPAELRETSRRTRGPKSG